jgi:ribosomal protein L11
VKNSNDDASSASSELNQIEEVFEIAEQTENKHEISTEVKVQCGGNQKMLLGLLDTGATSIFIKKHALKDVTHTIQKIDLKVKGQCSQSSLKEIATFEIKLPDFCTSRSVTIQAYVEDASIGRHDIVLGLCFVKDLGLIFDFKHYIVSWDDISAPMKKLGEILPEELSFIDPQDAQAPEIIQSATKRMEKAFTSNNYESYSYKSMILKCEHLTKSQQLSLMKLFEECSSLFDGTLGKVPNFKAKLELKPDAKP